MSDLWKKGKILYILSWYNRSIGLASLLVASLTSSLCVGLLLLFQDGPFVFPLTIVVDLMLVFMVVDASLILLNFLIMYNHLGRILGDLRKKGLPYDSLIGVEAIRETLKREIRYADILLASSIFSLIMFLLGTLGIVMFIYLSLTSALITFGFTVIKRKSALDPEEMLRIYEPNIYPVVLGSGTLLEAFIDPFHWLKFDDYKREVSTYLERGVSIGDALSKMTFLLYQAVQGAINENVVRKEVGELLKNEDYLSKLEEHEAFSFRTLEIVISKVRRFAPELTRLIDRLFLVSTDNLPDLKKSEIFIDAEASWRKRRGKMCNAFILLYNNQKSKSQQLSISYNAPSFSPSSGEVSITLPKRDFDLPSEDCLPICSETETDIVQLLSQIIGDTRFIWFSFETKETGGKPILISVKDKETGTTLFGRTFVVDVHYDLSGLLTKVITTFSVTFGVILSSFNFLRILLKF
jgi:hypothetical protein